MSKINIIRGYKEIQQGIQTFHKSVAHVDETVHVLACSALTHAAEHGDSTLCTMLVNAMPKSGRKAALVEWFITFGGIRWVTIGEESKFKKVDKKPYKLEDAYVTAFYDLTVDRVPKPFDFPMLLKLIEKATAKVEKSKEEGNLSVNSESYTRLNEAVSKLLLEVRPESIMEAAMKKAEAA